MKQRNKEAERDTLHSEISLQLHEELKKVMKYLLIRGQSQLLSGSPNRMCLDFFLGDLTNRTSYKSFI